MENKEVSGGKRLSDINPCLPYLREKVKKLPLSPGVYLMKDKKGKIIYVGKAKKLKNRVSTYFVDNTKRARKPQKLVERICDFDYIVVPKELDAFVLETSLIKQHHPKYNILLKDAKGFNYIKITHDNYPRLLYVFNTDDKKADYIGPYAGGFFVKQSVEDANKIFMLPSCNKKFPESFNKTRPCLNYRIKRCIGVCTGKFSQDEYKEIIDSAVAYIKKGSKESIAALTEQMTVASDNLEFEKAARLRDRITAMKKAERVEGVISSKLTDCDVIATAVNGEVAAIAVVKYSNGRLVDKETFFIGDDYDKPKMLGDFMLEFYSDKNTLPKEIYLESEIEDVQLFEEFLSSRKGSSVKITVPKRGEGLSQVMLTKSNADEFLSLRLGRKTRETATLEELGELLGLKKPPEYIECYDISNIGENIKVGGMVAYRYGKPYKKGYRKFTIKDVDGIDDYACMREVLRRRFTRMIADSCQSEPIEPPDSINRKPDLILIDGGSGHVSAVKGVMSEMDIDIPVFGLVKNSKHKTRAIASSGEEIQVNANKSVFSFLTKMQDEVHRFSVTFAQERHKKSSFALSLTQVPGIGEAKATALLSKFKTKPSLKNATVEELANVAKINTEKAIELKNFIAEL